MKQLLKLVGKQKTSFQLTNLSVQNFCVEVKQQKEVKPIDLDQTPIHLRPYNKEKYEVPSTKLKYQTGYAFLDVEPMPRARIMKLCYAILEKIRIIPETALYRVYTEEKLKYIMRLVDEIEDVKQLEIELGGDIIEMFIQGLHKELKLVDIMNDSKPWIDRPDNIDVNLLRMTRDELKNRRIDRPERPKTEFIDAKRQ